MIKHIISWLIPGEYYVWTKGVGDEFHGPIKSLEAAHTRAVELCLKHGGVIEDDTSNNMVPGAGVEPARE